MNRVVLLAALFLMACGKAPPRSFPDIGGYAGTFGGWYLERGCAPSFPVSITDSAARAETTVLRPEFLGMTILGQADDTLWAMECRYIRDSVFYIDPFVRGDTVWHGNLIFADSLYLSLARRQPPCLHLGDTVSSVIFRAAR